MESLRRAQYVQNLYNMHPQEDIVPEMRTVVDSMGNTAKDSYYFAALNVLIDRLFADGHYSEADSLAIRMHDEALQENDSLSLAISRRVRAQMLFKLSQPQRAYTMLKDATDYLPKDIISGKEFATATNIQEWLWIITNSLKKTEEMNQYGEDYSSLVARFLPIIEKTDTTGHYPVTAAAFRSQKALTNGHIHEASAILDSASRSINTNLPARAYEHFFYVRSKVRGAQGDWAGALADADTLLATHSHFPWFYLNDLLLKAELLNKSGNNTESARYYSEYIAYHDSLTSKITDHRLHDLTVLFQSEIDREQQRSNKIRFLGMASVVFLLLLLLAIAIYANRKERKRNRILVAQLHELDRVSETPLHLSEESEKKVLSEIERIDDYITRNRPYTDPSMGRKEIAERLGLTPESVGQIIKEERGSTVKTYINGFRLDEARHILDENPDISITDLAERLGFGTTRTLQRAFKERYDMSPSQYREAIRQLKQTD